MRSLVEELETTENTEPNRILETSDGFRKLAQGKVDTEVFNGLVR